MKKLILFLWVLCLSQNTNAQHINTIAAYDNQSSYTSGLYALEDTAVFRYSWYYQEWFPLENTGLTRINDTVSVSALAVYNNKSSNSSGLFVFSDTAVFNYNWITATWYALSNDGLPRVLNKPDVRQLTVYGDSGSSSNATVFALTDTAVYRYSWYYQEWTSLPNTGFPLSSKAMKDKDVFEAKAYPNPFSENFYMELKLPDAFDEKIEIAAFNEQGVLIKNYVIEKTDTFKPETSYWPAGMYFFEIKAGHFLKTIKTIRIK